MGMKKLLCATFEGIEAKSVDVELSMTKGLPSFSVVGMANIAINEAKERVKSALLNNDFTFPPKRITINLAPSDVKKEGSHFDLSMALLILLQQHEIDLENWYVFGELGLDGSVKENVLLYALLLSLANQGRIEKAIVPKESLPKLSKIPNIRFYGVQNLNEAVSVLEKKALDAVDNTPESFASHRLSIADQDYFYDQDYPEDFFEVKGQEHAKRAALIAAAGMHNILLEGSPGCGKSMIVKRLRYILPPLKDSEILDIAKLDTLEGQEPHFKALRPMRSPHHSATQASIFGGGSHRAMIGEVGLSHHGILFFDELPHFSKSVLEALREPLEDKKIRISRVHSKVEYPTNFLFVAAMNPCPCGNLLSQSIACRCSDTQIQQYKNRLSDPFLDRIDLNVTMGSVGASDTSTVSSQQLHKKVRAAFALQKKRGQKQLNGGLGDAEIEKHCVLSNDANSVLEQSITRFSLSFRSIKKVQKVARTIADLDSSETIEKRHLLEALSFRRR